MTLKHGRKKMCAIPWNKKCQKIYYHIYYYHFWTLVNYIYTALQLISFKNVVKFCGIPLLYSITAF